MTIYGMQRVFALVSTITTCLSNEHAYASMLPRSCLLSFANDLAYQNLSPTHLILKE